MDIEQHVPRIKGGYTIFNRMLLISPCADFLTSGYRKHFIQLKYTYILSQMTSCTLL